MKTDLTIKCTGLNENEQKTEQRFWPNFTDHMAYLVSLYGKPGWWSTCYQFNHRLP